MISPNAVQYDVPRESCPSFISLLRWHSSSFHLPCHFPPPALSLSFPTMVMWKDAAFRNPVLTAAELYFMAHPDERVPWRKLLSFPPHPPSSHDVSPSVATPAPERWGARKRRTSKATAAPTTAKATALVKEAEEKSPGRASPTTPLSWNACEFGTGVRDSASAKKRSVGAGSVVNSCRGGGGSAKVASELREREWSLLEKNTLLKKEVEKQKLARSMLIEENKRLKSLKSKLHHQVVAETDAANARSEETRREEHRLLPFDLNLPFRTADLEDATTD